MKDRLKILCFVDTFFPVVGGMSRIVDFSATALSKYADITVVAVEHHTDYVDPKRPYKLIRCKGFYNSITKDGMAYPDLDKNLKKEILEGEYDCIHCHSCGNFFDYARRMAKKLNIPLISTVHNFIYFDALRYLKIKPLCHLIAKSFMKKTDKSDYIFAVSEYCKNFIKRYGVKKPILVVRNAINYTDEMKAEYNLDEINKYLNIKSQDKLFTHVSRVEKNKNADLIVNSVESIYKENKDRLKNIKIAIVGTGTYLEKLKNRVAKLGLNEYFIFTGLVKEVDILSKIYQRTSLILFPSVTESCGLMHIEASTYNKPSIVIDKMATSENVIDGYNGLIAQNNTESFKSKMLYAIDNEEELARMGKNARNTLYRSYYDDNVIQELINCYKFAITDFKYKYREEEKIANKTRKKERKKKAVLVYD